MMDLKKIKTFIQMNRIKSTKPFRDDVKSIFRTYKGQMIWISILSWFLLFLLNILVWVSMYGNTLNDSLRDKLWMYFYLKDDWQSQTQVYKQVFILKDKLEDAWLQVKFLTKEDAMDFMMKRLPELTWSLEKFWPIYTIWADRPGNLRPCRWSWLQRVPAVNVEKRRLHRMKSSAYRAFCCR